MEFVSYIAIGVFGLTMGSFVNAWVWRTHRKATCSTEYGTRETENNEKVRRTAKRDGNTRKSSQESDESGKENTVTTKSGIRTPNSVLRGRSQCPDCGSMLHAKDLIPVISWIWLRGKCRYCDNSISVQYPVVEIITTISFLLVLLWWPFALNTSLDLSQLVVWLFITTVVIAMSVYDIRWYQLPDAMLGTLLVLTVLRHSVTAASDAPLQEWLIAPLAGAAGAFVFFYGLYALGRGRWMGGGDVKLVFVLGLLIGGVSTIVALFIAFLSAAALGIVLMITQRKSKRDMVPFGPFLLAGFWLSFFFGDAIADWYVGLITAA